MSIYKRFKTDADLEAKSGIELDYGDGVKIRVLRAGGSNLAFQKALREALIKHGRRLSAMSDDESVRGMAEIYADTVIVGWEGISDENDEPLPFSKANVVKVLTELPELFRDIQSAAQSVDLFRAERRAELVGK